MVDSTAKSLKSKKPIKTEVAVKPEMSAMQTTSMTYNTAADVVTSQQVSSSKFYCADFTHSLGFRNGSRVHDTRGAINKEAEER